MWLVANHFGLSLQHSSVDQCNDDACNPGQKLADLFFDAVFASVFASQCY